MCQPIPIDSTGTPFSSVLRDNYYVGKQKLSLNKYHIIIHALPCISISVYTEYKHSPVVEEIEYGFRDYCIVF